LRRGTGAPQQTRIGPSYLLDVAKADGEDRLETLEFVWNDHIVPLLEEYFYTQREKLAQLLTPFSLTRRRVTKATRETMSRSSWA
jgi:hypothetical protein